MKRTAVPVDLTKVPTDELLTTILGRLTLEELVVWPKGQFYSFVTRLTPLPCVDAFPMRRGKGETELGLILRNSGFYKGKWWCIGGRVWSGESFGVALTRNIRETLGVGFTLAPGDQSWNKPVFMSQQAPMALAVLEGELQGHEPSKQCSANTYVVVLDSEDFTFGSTTHGGQEAGGFRWFPLDEIPWRLLAYGGRGTVRAVVDWIQRNDPFLGRRSR